MKFRITFVVILLLLFMGINSQGQQKQWVASSICQNVDIGWSKSNYDMCEASGCAYYWTNGISILSAHCDSCAPDGAHTLSPSYCCSGKSKEYEGLLSRLPLIGWAIPNEYQCIYNPTPLNEQEMEIASVVQGMGLFEANSTAAYYAAIFGGGILLLLILGAIL